MSVSPLWAGNYYAGAIGAVSTLSADGRSMSSPTASAVSLYKPENGPAVNVFLGRYLGNDVSVQANYIWNSNGLAFVASRVLTQDASFYSETRGSSETSVVGDVLVFFRDRHSLVRPYLSCGIGGSTSEVPNRSSMSSLVRLSCRHAISRPTPPAFALP